MRSFVFAAGFIAVAADVDQAWEDFKTQFPKAYNSPSEESQRKAIFAENYANINAHNQGDSSYQLGVNQFADLTLEEFAATYTGRVKPAEKMAPVLGRIEAKAESELAASIDWTTLGAVTPVKDQGQCGSCWSFSATGATEGGYQVAAGKLVSLAEQQLVDCDTADGNSGCNGGWENKAVEYFSGAGACSEASYPYKATDGTCKQSSCTLALRPGVVSGVQEVQTDSAAALKTALMTSPTTLAINANGFAFQFYKSGVLTNACSGYIDHAVLAVGYGIDASGTPYFKVKNSWGTSWGDAGYFKVGQNNNLCTLDEAPGLAVISASVTV